ncbi:hypothetical protein SKAU_G00212310 [Synaphobranchus kaupii]|uniref:Doublecortin domain-containing protein 2 n=1 Tax=Synaphobranchus kaupii TaxID=118154 RepID=A0A9Q1F903_SYNKA|nr:hypothetical protein SKAU_G00212310 [Synaphobranchus kaupii]
MNSDKPTFLSQPVVKNILMYRNGDPYYEGRRLVINEKRVSSFETFLKEVTGGIQAPYGAVRTIYTPKAGHRVSSLEHLQSGEQYVAAGKEKFKKLDYLQIGTKKKRILQSNGQVKPIPQSRIIVSARFLKPIKEPCTIFILGNGDVMNPAVRLLIPPRILVQYERVLEMITEKMRLRILGGARSLYTLDGAIISEGKDLENGQFYVAVGREKFKKLPYSDLIFNKPVGIRRFVGSKAASLPPIYRFRKQNGNQEGRDQSKSMVSSSDAGESKTSPPAQQNKDHLASIVSELSQARLLKLRQKRSGLTMSLGGQSNGDGEQGAAENPGESSSTHEAQPPDGSKDDTSAEEKQISGEAKETSEDEGVEKPRENGDGDPASSAGTNRKEEQRNDNTASPDGEKGNNEEKDDKKSEEKSDSPSPVPDGTDEKNKEKSDEKEDEGKWEEEKEEAKPEDREAETEGQSGEGEVSDNGTDRNSPEEGVSKDQGEEGQDKPGEEKAGSSDTEKENAEAEDKSSDQQSDKEEQGGKQENK